MCCKETEFEDMDWIHPTQVGALWWDNVNTVTRSIQGGEFLHWPTDGFRSMELNGNRLTAVP
jgi:hypothetical protein